MLFADPRRSAVDIVQAVGRALRPAPGKKLGYVIVPILHDADATPDDIFDSDSFQEVLTTLRALAANEDRIIEYFRTVSQGRQRTGGGTVQFDMDERLAKRIDLAQFVRDIDLRCWDRLARLSWRPFDEARAFAQKLKLKSANEWRAYPNGAVAIRLTWKGHEFLDAARKDTIPALIVVTVLAPRRPAPGFRTTSLPACSALWIIWAAIKVPA